MSNALETALAEATAAQIHASRPDASTWVSANAGSGKTRVLTDRVARLLLHGTPPEKILCLTYTNAAAAEMQSRLFSTLGKWAMLDDDALTAELGKIDEVPNDLGRARTLFASALETPGGLKIQTIHAFCGEVLQRFPVEARVPPRFQTLDEGQAERLRLEVIDAMARDEDDGAFDAMAAYLSSDMKLDPMLLDILQERELLERFDPDALKAALGIGDETAEDVIADVMGRIEMSVLREVYTLMQAGGTNDRKYTAGFSDCFKPVSLQSKFDGLKSGLMTKDGDRRSSFGFPSSKVDQRDWVRDRIAELQDIVAVAADRIKAARLRDRSMALHRFAGSFLHRYDEAKSRRGWLDFDDLIRATDRLLNTADMAEWVLYKLDGGIDHILVDEAQDTSPEQWSVIRAIEAEFTSGEGARDIDRTLFVVGDQKQSIFSFQGADPAGFGTSRDRFRQRLEDTGGSLATVALTHSFRSAEPILTLVDRVFAEGTERALGGPTLHRAMPARPGRVEVWDFDAVNDRENVGEVLSVRDRLAKDDPVPRLARDVADHIASMIGQTIPGRDGPRPVRPGDILVLVRGRTGPFFHTLIDALKARGVPVAGADRLRIRDEIAVKDLISTLRFLTAEFDDLALAEALRSPLFSLTEAELYRLAHDREGRLWEALLRSDHAAAVAMLSDLRSAVDFSRPYEILEKILLDQSGRERLVARLGPECEDAIDELLGQALQYEQSETPSLDGFLNWLGARDIEVKRNMEAGRDEVRVMTVHGAKGLEAPIVVVPDVQVPNFSRQAPAVTDLDGLPVWSPKSEDMPDALQAAKEARKAAEEEEHLRLLYVALTRAETWLLVCGAGSTKSEAARWHTRVRSAMEDMGAVAEQVGDRSASVVQSADWPDAPATGAPAMAEPSQAKPDWCNRRPPGLPPKPKIIHPSDLGDGHALPGEYDGTRTAEEAMARGSLIHALVEHFPEIEVDLREDLAKRLSPAGMDWAEALEEAARTVDAPEFRWLFGEDTLREVGFSVRAPSGPHIVGRIDLVHISGNRVLAVDVKSNRIIPEVPEACPGAILAQMGAYSEALRTMYPGREIEVAILWTAGPVLMEIPHDLVTDAFRNATSP